MNWITYSQFIFAIGTILLIRKIVMKREILEGFDLLGSLITWIAMAFVLYQFYEWGDWIGLVTGFMQWGFGVIFTGAIWVPLDPMTQDFGLSNILNRARCSILVTSGDNFERLK